MANLIVVYYFNSWANFRWRRTIIKIVLVNYFETVRDFPKLSSRLSKEKYLSHG